MLCIQYDCITVFNVSCVCFAFSMTVLLCLMSPVCALHSGGRYLTIPEVGNKRSGRGARLVLPLIEPWNSGNLCLSFRHKLAGHHVGVLQVFVKKGRQYSPAVWGRTGGHGWRHTQITLWGDGLGECEYPSSRYLTSLKHGFPHCA